MKKIIFYVFTSVFIVSCNLKESNKNNIVTDEVKRAIAESNTVYWQAFTTGDSSLFIKRYAEDACIMPPNSKEMCGKKAASTFFNVAYKIMGIRSGKFTTTNVFPGNDEYVTENGLFELRDANGKLIDNGKYLVLWKKTDKGWKMYKDCFNSDNPSLPFK